MKSFTIKTAVLCAVTFTFLVIQSVAQVQSFPNPVLAFLGSEPFQVNNAQKIRYRFDVANKAKYPDELFAAAPTLPPCGTNTKSSRTWIDILDQRGRKLNSFCALTKADLDKIWFALDPEVVPPSWVYIEMTDRQTNTKYKSNLAETTQ